MGGVAALARELGHEVEGSDQAVYPPMSTQLERLGIGLRQGYDPGNISAGCDQVVIGNALSRGNAAVEHVLDHGSGYISGGEWLRDRVHPGRDQVVIGNALSRGNPAVEHVLDRGSGYISGAEWLRDNVLPGRDTIAVAGTDGKTTTTTLLAWLLEAAGRSPGFLIGGVAEDF